MKHILIPAVLLLFGIGAGAGAGIVLGTTPDNHMSDAGPCGEVDHEPDKHTTTDDHHDGEHEYARLSNQFVIPVVDDGIVTAMVVISVSLEVKSGNKEPIFAAEPKIRDAFLQVMFNHANVGGFSDNFTSGPKMRSLRDALLAAAIEIAGDRVTDVLIVEIVRQDV